MKYIKKIWVRILISILFGGVFTETIAIITGNRLNPTIIPTLICFGFLSAIVWFDYYKYYFFPNWGLKNKNRNKNNDDILDDGIE